MKKNARGGMRTIHTHEAGAHALNDEFRRKRRVSAGWIPNRTPIAHLVALALGAGLSGPASAQIVANGRTATTVTTNGTVTNVTTATTRGVNAFNAFSQFVVDGGHLANLHLPGSTQNLVNLVDSQVQINGTLNSLYSSGKIGGNVFFASPQGFVVGVGGVVNVGKLVVSTPTAGFIDDLIDGDFKSADVDALMNGTARNAGGLITIEGQVNALDGVELRGGSVDISGAVHAGATALSAIEAHVALNLTGMPTAIGAERDGDIIRLLGDNGSSYGVSSGDILITATKVVDVDAGITAANAVVDISGDVIGHGDVTIKAVATDKQGSGQATANAAVTISGSIEGKNIAATADATASSEYTNDLMDMVVTSGVGALTGINLSTVAANADATVTIASGASLEAAEDITLHADATRIASTPAINIASRKVGATAVFGDLQGETSVQIASGADVKAGGDLEAKATSDNEIDVSAYTITSTSGTYFAGTFAYSQADITTKADIASGATIKAANVGVQARNENSFSTSATAMANGEGVAGAAAAIADIDVHTSATLGANLSGANGTGGLTILAENYTDKNKTSASATTGSGLAVRVVDGAAGKAGGFIQSKAGSASDKVGDKVDGKGGSGSALKIAAALALSDVNLDAKAGIADNTQIDATGDVAVLAKLEDAGVRNNANSLINAQVDKGDAKVAVSAGVAVGEFEHTAEATIGDNVRINAKHIGVGADVALPITITWHKWEGLDSILPKLNANLGLLNEVLTSYAGASSESSEFGIAGATNYFESNNNARAWVGKGSTLTATGNRDAWTTSYVDRNGDAKSWIWKEAVDVQAHSLNESINIAGNINFLNPISGTTSAGGGGSVGAAFNWIQQGSNTIAGVGDGVTVTTSGVSVNATTDDRMIVVSPTSGSGGGFGGNGIVALSLIDNITHASISNEANITADAVTLDAAQGLSVWSAAGSLSREESAAIGIAVAVNDVTADTKAYIGDNDADSPSGDDSDGATGTITTDSLSVNAIADGMVGTFAVAGAVAKSDDPDAEPGLVDRTKSKISGKVDGLRNKAADKMTGLPLLGSLADKVRTKEGAAADDKQPTKPPFGIAVSGAASVNISSMDTSASIDGVTINSRTAGQTDVLTRAITNTDLISGAGGAALAAAKNPSAKFSAGVAGAVAFNQLDNDTYAGIKNATINDAGEVKVEALSAGDQISVGLGIALNTSQDQSKAGVAAGSVSLTMTENSTKAEIAGSTIKGDNSGDDTVEVTAYDRARIANGGGSFTYGGKVGVGAAVSFAEIKNSAEAIIDGGQLSDLDSVGVFALSASRIVNAAAMGSYGSDTNSINGSFVFTNVDKDVLATVRNGAQLDADGNVSVVASGTGRDSNLDALLTADRDNDVAFSLDRGDAEAPEDDQLIGDGRVGEDRGGEAIIGVAGQLAVGKNNLGLSFVGQTIHNTYEATIESATVNAGGDVKVAAQDAAQIIGVAVGIGGAKDKFAGMGSAVANVTVNNVEARIGAEDDTAPATSVTGANVDVTAKNSSEIYAGAGNIAASKNTAAGAAIAYNQTTNTTKALVKDATLNAGAGKVTLDALSESAIRGLAASGVGSEEVAIGASLNFNLITDTVEASVTDATVTGGSLSVKARDRDDDSGSKSSIWSLAGNVSGAGKTAVGGAFSVNTVANTIDAAVDGSTLTIGGKTEVDADSGSEIYSIAVAGAGSNKVAAGLSDSTNTVTNNVTARFNNTTLTDGAGVGSLDVTASDRLTNGDAGAKIWSIAGNATGAGKVAVGLAAAINTVTNTIAADISGNSDITLDGAVNVDADSATEIKTMAVAGGGAGTASVQGSGTINTITNTVRAKVSGATTKITASGLDVHASERDDATSERTSIWSLAGTGGGAGKVSVGASVAVNTIANTLSAEIDGGTYTIDGATNVTADAGAEIMTMAVGGGGAGTLAAGGSIALNTITNDVIAKVANASVTDDVGSAGSLTVGASDRLTDGSNGTKIWALAGNAQGAGTASLGVAAATNTIANELSAEVSGTTVDVGGDVKVDADSAAEIKSAAVAGGGAGTATINGSVAVNTVANTAVATVSGGSIKAANLAVTASERNDATDHRTSIWSLAGTGGGAGTATIGAAAAINTIANNLDVLIENTTIDVGTGTVKAETNAGAEIKSAAASGGGAGTAAVTGAVAINTIASEATAKAVNATITADSLTVKAHDRKSNGDAGSLIQSLAGNVSGAGTASVGLASAVNTISNRVEAGIDGSTLTIGDETTVEAKEKATIQTLAADGGGAGTAAIGGSATVNNIANTTRAGISNTSNIGAGNDTQISASDTSSVDSIAGAFRAGGQAGVGFAASVNRIGNTVETYLSGNKSANAYQAKDVVLDAASDASIRTIALGVGFGGSAGVAGSVATNILDTNVTSRIDGGALVQAENNVGVLAANSDKIEVVAGAAGIGVMNAGVGLSTVVNVLESQTVAKITGATTRVNALGKDASDTLTVKTGELDTTPDIGETPDADSFDWYDLEGKTRQVSGVAVNAFSTQQVGSVSAAAGITAPNPKGSAAVGATAGVNVLAGATEAYVDGAQINKNNTGAGAGQDVEILAAGHTYSTSFVAGAAISGDVAMGGALDTTVINRDTRAYARNADITATEDIRLSAQSGQGARAIGASAGGAIVGGAGTGMVGIISGTTEAYLDTTTVRSIDLDVNAASRSGINLMGGSLSLGAASIGGAFAVGVSDQTTRAYIHDGAAHVSGNAGVTADAETNFWNLAVAGAAGGTAVSGMAAVNVVSNTTEAYIDGADIGTSGAKANALTVSAEDDVEVRSYGGAVGLAAGSSVGAAANVTVVQSRVAAEVKNADVYATNALDVKALSSVDAEHVTVAVGAGMGVAGVAGSASLILLGNGTSGEAMSELNKDGDGILSKVFDLSDGDKVSETNNLNEDQLDALNNSDAQDSKNDLAGLDADREARLGNTELSLSGGELTDANDSGKYDTAKHFEASADADVTRAAITGGTIDTGSVSVTAEDKSRTSNVAGAGGAAFAGLGAGGGVAITRVYNDVQAVVNATSLSSGQVTLAAKAVNGSGDAASATAYAGAAGPVGLGAAWADAYVENDVLASLSGNVDASGAVSVEAEDSTSAKAESIGASVGAAAAGISVAMAEKSSEVRASAGGSMSRAASLHVQALSAGSVTSKSIAAAGGLLGAGTGAGADAFDRSVVRAYIADNADIDVDGAIDIEATAKPQTRAEALGIAVGGGIGIGASVAKAEANTDVAAHIGAGASIATNSLNVVASSVKPDAGQTAYAKASGGSGGVLFGANATVADASSENTVLAYVDAGATITTSGSVGVSAGNSSEQDAEAFGIAAGIVAAGANVAMARSDSTTEARFDGKLEGVPMVRVYDYVNKKYVFVPRANFSGPTATSELRIYTVPQDGGGEVEWVQYLDPTSGKHRYATLAAYNSANPVPANENNTGKPVGAHVAPADYKHPVMVFLAQDVDVSATGEDDNFAKAIAGSGGVIAGHAATASTTNNSSTKATLQSAGSTNTIRASNVTVDAAHIARFNAEVDSVNAAIAGASGAITRHNVATDTDAMIGAGAKVEAHDVTVKATDTIRKDWLSDYNVRAASGGLLSGAAADSVTTVTQSTDAIVGTGAALKVVGSRNATHVFDIAAINDFEIRDKVKLDTGGAIAVAMANNRVEVEDSQANVTIQGGATLDSVGGMNLYAITHGRAEAQTNAKTYGIAGVAEGDSRARITASQTIGVGGNASLRADGEIRLGAGRAPDGTPNDIFATAQTDIWNKAAAPITIIGAGGRVEETATINLAANSKVRGVTDITLLAEKGVIGGSGRYTGMDLYRKAAQEASNAVGDLVGGGESSWALTGGNSTTIGSSSVLIDGLVESGIQNEQYLIIGWDKATQTHYIKSVSDEGITYTVTEETLAQGFQQRLDQLYALRDEHSGNTDAVTAYNLEIQRIEEQLRALTGGGGAGYISRDVVVGLIDVAPILAAAGNIRIEGDKLNGGGRLISPGDAKIEVVNETPYFLRVSDLIIPDHPGGLIRFNGSTITDNASINELNPGGSGAGFSEVVTGANSPEPSILVKNTFDPDAAGSGAPAGTVAPDIYINGNVRNMLGTVTVQAIAGSVVADGVINAKTINLSAGRDFILGYTEGFRHIGGSPEGLWSDVTRKLETGEYVLYNGAIYSTILVSGVRIPFLKVADRDSRNSTGALVAGNNVYISGRYLNINGTIQSGLPDWNLNIGNLDSQIANAENLYAKRLASGNADPYFQLLNWSQGNDPNQTRKVTAWWNAKENRIELDGIKVEGGYMELFGQIINTGGGHLKVLDGYGTIKIDNTSGRDLALRTLDVGNGVEGTIKITDLGKRINGDTPLTTVYKRLGSDVMVWDNGTVDASGNPTRLVQTHGNTRNLNATQGYKPTAGQRYYWVTGESFTDYEKFKEKKSSKTFFDLFPLSALFPDNYSYSNPQWTWSNTGRSLAEGQYLKNVSGQYDGYSYSKTSADTTGWSYGEIVKWDKCTDRFLGGCVERTYYAEQTRWKGSKTFYTHSVDADHGIAISFIGNDNGLINVDSNAGVLLGGLINNPNGTTTINAGTHIERLTGDALIVSKDLNLTAGKGIGTQSIAGTLAGVNVDVTGVLTATSTIGDIVLKDTTGDLNVNRITTGNGNVDVTAQNNLYLTGTVAGNVIRGNEITLTATNGSIGKSDAAVNLDTGAGEAGLFTASASNGIYVKETSGDLRLNTVHAGGNVYIESVNGNITDGNRNDARDTRAEEQLLALWDDMDLLGAEADAAADKSVLAYAQGKEQEYRQYWDMRNAHQDGSGNWVVDAYDADYSFSFGAEERNLLKQQNGLSDGQISQIESARTDSYHNLHGEFGAGSYDPNFAYVVDAGKIAEIKEGAAWTTNQLKYSVSKGAFSGSGDTEMRIETANVKGNNVTLVANSGGIGSTLADDVIIDLSGGIASLTDAQRIALASAERDDVSFEGPDGKIIRIVQRDDVDVETTAGGITALAQNEIFLGGEKDVNVTDVRSPVIRIKAGQSIIDTQVDTPAIRGGEVILEASNGSLGAADNALDVAITGKFTARAQQDINIVQHNGGLLIDRFNAGGDLTLNVLDGGIAQLNSSGVTLTAENLNLITSGSVGTAGNAVSVQHGAGGSLQATTGGDLHITGGSLALNTINAGGAVGVTTTVDTLNFIGHVQSGGDAAYTAYTDAVFADGVMVGSTAGDVAVSAENVTMGVGSQIEAGEEVQITADGDVSVAQITAHRANGDAITIDAQGTINGDGGSDLTATSAGANVVLSAGQGIGSGTQALSVEAPNLDASTATGDVDLHLLADTHASQILATDGAINVVADANLGFDTIQSTGDIDLDVVGAATGTTLQATAGSVDVQADSANLVNVDASGNAIITTTGAQTLGTVTTNGNQTLMAGTALTAGTLNVGGTLNVDAASADITTAGVTGTADIVSSGNQIIGSLTAGGRMTLDAGGDLTYTTLEGDENLVATVDGRVQGGAADFDGTANITAGTAELAHVQTGDSADVTTTGDLTIDEVIAATSLTVDAANAALTLASAGTTADVTTTGSQVIGSLTTGGDQTLNAGGDIEFTTLVSGNDLTGTAIGDIRGGSATAAGTLTLTAGGSLDVDGLTATSGLMTLDVIGNASYTTLSGGENLIATVGGHLQGQDADFDGVVTINAGSADLGHVQTAVNADIATTGDLSIDEVIAGTTLTVDAGGDATIGTATSTNNQHLHADDLLTAGALTSQAGAIAIGDAATQTGSANITTTNAATTFTTHTSGDQTLGSITTGGEQSLNAGGTITAGTLTGDADLDIVAGALVLDQATFDGDATVNTEGDQQIGTLDTEGSIALTTEAGQGGDIVYGHLEAGAPETVGATEERLTAPSITVVADGELRRLTPTTGDAHAEGMLNLKAYSIDVGDLKSAGADVVLEATVDVVADLAHAKRDLRITAGNDMRIGEALYGGEMSLVAGRNLWAKIGGDIKFAVAEVGGNADLSSGGEIEFDSLKAGGYVNLDAAGDVTIDDKVEAGESISVVSGGDANIGALTSTTGSITVQATGDVNIDSMAATQGAADASGANVHVNEVAGNTGNFDAVDTLRIDTARMGERLDLAGRDVVAKVIQTRPVDPFVMNLTGHAGGLADVADLHITSNNEVGFDKVYGKQVDVQTTSDQISIDDAYVPGVLTMETPAALLVAQNLSVAPVKGANVQLHEQDYRFRVMQTGTHTDTNAYVLRYSPGYTIAVPNFSENHVDGGPLVRGESALFFAERMGSMARNNAIGGNGAGGNDAPGVTGSQTGEDGNPFMFPTWPQGLLNLEGIFGPATLPLTLPDGPAVNFGVVGANGFNRSQLDAAQHFGGVLLTRVYAIDDEKNEEE